MESTLLNQIIAGTPGVMIVVGAADLKEAIAEMWESHKEETARAIRRHRERPTISRTDAATALGVDTSTLWRWERMGYLVPVRIGTKVLYRASDIEEMLNRKKDKE